ncbi:MAG: hypothetical protein JWR69_2687 [Pedosphaera sp.]|nr:hypothetical protein [Pedosphaera sp.]
MYNHQDRGFKSCSIEESLNASAGQRNRRFTVPPRILLRSYAAIICFWLVATGRVWGADTSDPLVEPGPGALTNALAQIGALQDEARALSPTQKKIATPLLDALREFRGAAPRRYAPKVRSNHKLMSAGTILVDIRGQVSDSLLIRLKAQGANIHSSHLQYESIRAEIPIAALELIAADADVKFIRPADLPIKNAGTAVSEGFYAEEADVAQSAFGVTGAGVKVGVISDSVRYLANSQGHADLGLVNILAGQNGLGTNGDEGEGTAMLEIVHDLAPDAQLYFATGFGGIPSMATNIIALADAGCDIIIDDVTYQTESPFHANQPIAQAVQTVSDRGVLYFSSAANSGNFTHGTSGTWTGDFSTFNFSPGLGQLHNWGGTPFNQITKQSGAVTLFWSDPMGASTNNYNLFITDVNGNVLRQSITVQNGANDPYEAVAASTNSGEYVVVALAAGTQRDIYVNTGRGRLAHGTTGSTRGHNAAPAANAFSVAATTAHGIGTGFHFAGGTNNPVESFSSDGFPRIFFEANGAAVTPGNFLSTGGRILLKPDFTAADGAIASTNTFPTNVTDFTPFYGTSAAAPHAGAIAALIKSYRPDLTPQQIRLAMMNTALDIESIGFDVNSGAGIVMAEAALLSVDNTPPLVAVVSPAHSSAIALLTNISGTASDIGSGLQGNQIHFTLFNNGNLWSGTYWTNTVSTDPSILLTASVVSGAWTFTNVPTGGAQVPGTYYISAFARDNAGNLSTPQSDVTSTSFTIDTAPPNVAITFPPDGSTITNQLAGNWFQGIASDSPGNNLSLSLFIRRNSDNLYWTGSGWGDVTNGFISNTYNSGNQTWQSTGGLPVPGSSLANGDYHFIAIARDAAGNQQQVDSVVSVDFHRVFVFTAGSLYDNDPNNNNLNWNNPANWDVGQVPTVDSIVVINSYALDNTALGSLNYYRLDMSGGSLATLGLTLQKFNLSGGSLTGPITIAANGVFNWSGGSLGNCTLPGTATLNVTGAGDKVLAQNSTLSLSGKTVWAGAGNLATAYGCQINNTGTFSIQSDAQFYNYTGGLPSPVFNNTGVIQKTNATGVTVISAVNGGWIFNNNGTLDIEAGVLSSQTQLYLNHGTVFAGAGVTRVDAGNATLAGTNTLQAGATFAIAGGTVTGTNTFGGAGAFNWSGGTISAALSLQSNVVINLSGAGDKTLAPNSTINNAGNAMWTGAGRINVGYGSVFNNTGGFVAQNDAQFYNHTAGLPAPLFINSGSFTKTNSTGSTAFYPDNGGVAFNNTGSVSVQSGNLALGGGGASQNASFNVASGSRIDLTGGAHNFGPALNFNGGLTRMLAGSLNLTGTNLFAVAAAFELVGGTVTGTNTFAGAGAFNWSGGTISAVLSLQSNVDFNISGAADKTLAPNSMLNTAGSVAWTGGGQINVGYGSVFNSIHSFVAQNDAQFYNSTAGLPVPLFINAGSFTKTNSPGTTAFNAANGGVAFNNTGSVSVQSGALTLGGGGASANDSFTAAAGSLIDFTAGAFVFNGNQALLGGGTNRVNGATLTFNNATNTMGGAITFEIAAGSIAGTNTFSGAGTVNWSSGTISAALSLQSNIAVNISGAYPKTLAAGGTIAVAGNTLWTGGGDINVGYASAFINNGTFNVQSGSQFYNYTAGLPVPVFVNNGRLLKSTIAATTTFHGASGGVAFNNNGTINVQAGDLILGGGGAGTNGICTAAAGSHIDLTGGGFNWSGNSVISGAGVTRVNSGNLTFRGGATTVTGTFEVAAGSAGGTNTLAGSGTFNWTSGSLFGNLILQSNLAFNISVAGDKTLQPNSTIDSAGTATWSGNGNLNMAYGSAINNSGTFIAQNDMQFFNYTAGAPAPVFNNSGTFRKSGSTGQTGFHPSNGGVNFNNTGVVDLRSGTLVIWAAYATSPSNQLKIPIGGLSAGTEFGSEYFPGVAAFDGTLGISLTNGFTPTNGNSFTLATYGSRTGQFTSTQFPPLPVESRWQLSYNPSSLVLQVVPSTVFLSSSLTNGNFQSSFIGQAGSMCVIEASTNLLNWTPLLTNTPFNGRLQFVDPQTSQFVKRFYWATIFP